MNYVTVLEKVKGWEIGLSNCLVHHWKYTGLFSLKPLRNILKLPKTNLNKNADYVRLLTCDKKCTIEYKVILIFAQELLLNVPFR